MFCFAELFSYPESINTYLTPYEYMYRWQSCYKTELYKETYEIETELYHNFKDEYYVDNEHIENFNNDIYREYKYMNAYHSYYFSL